MVKQSTKIDKHKITTNKSKTLLMRVFCDARFVNYVKNINIIFHNAHSIYLYVWLKVKRIFFASG